MTSKEAKKALESLTEIERAVLKKDTPHTAFRNEVIKKLRRNDVTIKTIQEISGMSRTVISRIYPREINVGKRLLDDIRRVLNQVNMKLDKIDLYLSLKHRS
ncbi:MAG: hypothetical protein PHD57_11505 [Desulfobacterales bacterium]|jgi:uncharacterized protein YerC|nr:hypothetical protein [Desulfobacterales bacterium]MDD3082773.1 hypothetical protein [Desulfobacterales bacterium]MDD3951860.1 hypothetical protein [Desulfobacterales bacterium]